VNRFTVAIVVGVLALVTGSLVLALSFRDREPQPDLATPEGVTLAYALAVQRGDADVAWELLSPSARSQTTRDRFESRLNYRDGRARLSVEHVHLDGDTARVDLVRTYAPTGSFPFGSSTYASHNTVRLTREPAGWRISTVPVP
jgi:hypothetical protein